MMGIDRRDFIKIAGLTMLGIAGKQTGDVLLCQGLPQTSRSPKALTATRWAMVINPQLCLQESGCRDCINACHNEHNVPDFGNPKDEIKWIWKEPFEHAFLEQEH